MRVWPVSHLVIPSYTRHVKTAVSIPDPLFEAADRLARRRRVSRSALYAEALRLLLAGEDDADAAITARLDAVLGDAHAGREPSEDIARDPVLATANAELWNAEW